MRIIIAHIDHEEQTRIETFHTLSPKTNNELLLLLDH